MAQENSQVNAFLEAASVPLEGLHVSGTLAAAEEILRAHPEIATANIYTAAVLGDEAAVRGFLADDPAAAARKGGHHNWDALNYLCFSRYLRLDAARSDAFVRAATALLDAGADPNTGWFEAAHQPNPCWESAIYGAAGLAQNAALTRLLLERGADPNDDETPYHTPESYDLAALKAIVESGKLTENSLTMMLVRKADWHDYDGVKYLLEHGANPSQLTRWHVTALQHSIRRGNGLPIIELMIEHGVDSAAVSLAIRRGRRDILELLDRREIAYDLHGVEKLIAACARNDATAIHDNQHFREELLTQGGTLLAEFAGHGNTEGVRQLLDLGVDPAALYGGDGYFDIAPRSTALHVAAWKAHPSVVKLLIERGAPVNARDGEGRTALQLAVRACVDSYWMRRRTPESVAALLAAGATTEGVKYPCGYAEVDALLATSLPSSP